MLFSIPLVFFNFYTGFSGVTYVNDYFYALFEVILTTFAIGGYVLFEVDISPYYKDAGKHNEFLAKVYKSQRINEVAPVYTKLGIWFTFAWYSGMVIFYTSFYSYNISPVDSAGLMDGLWTSGFAGFTILLTCHHGIIFMETRNISVPIVLSYLLSVLCFMPLTCWLMDITPGTMYRSVFEDALAAPTFYLVVVVGSSAILMPYYAIRRYDELVWRPFIYCE